MGPKPRKVEPMKRVRFAANVGEDKEGESEAVDGADGNAERSSHDNDRNRSEVLVAVIDRLEECRESWVSKLYEVEAAGSNSNQFASFNELGQIALSMATCARFLRVGWESHSSKWFQDCWRKRNVWELPS